MKKILLFLACVSLGFIEFYRIAFTENIANVLVFLFNSPLFTQKNANSSNIIHLISSSIDTGIYSFIHSILIICIIHLYFKNQKYTIYTVGFIVFLLFSCVLCFVLYKITGLPFFYRFTEDLIYTTLSPTPLLLLFGFFGLALKKL
jgi:hypothetical protein